MIDGSSIYSTISTWPFFKILTTTLLIIAAYRDLKYRLIPNKLTAVIAALGIARLVAIGDPIFGLYTVVAAFLVFLVTFLLFSRGLLGGGDVKLLAATVLVIGYRDLYPFIAVMAACGAMLSGMIMIMRSRLPFYLGVRLGSAITTITPSVPYGVAIAAGAIVILFLKTSNIG